MLIFNLKKVWFDKIKNGEKTHEYREVKPYWDKRIQNAIKEQMVFDDETDEDCPCICESLDCELVCGYPSKDDTSKKIRAKIKSITKKNGLDTDLAIDKEVYDFELEVL